MFQGLEGLEGLESGVFCGGVFPNPGGTEFASGGGKLRFVLS